MTSKISIYNGALMECGERALASLSENREPRRLLDGAWDRGAVNYCLTAGQWKFAKRTRQLVASTSVVPEFGYRKAYPIPDDHLRTTALCSDEYMSTPLTQYVQEQGYWFADVEPIYVSYVSDDASYGNDMSLWPMEFVRYIEAYLASMICEKLTQDKDKWARLYKLTEKRLTEARSGDAMEGPTVFPPIGSWASARLRGGNRRDRGSRGSLIG